MVKIYIILVYDVDHERVNKICNFLKCYLNWIQNSVFEGEITESNLEKIKIELKKLISSNDSIIIFEILNQKSIKKEIIGKEKQNITRII